MKKYLPKKMTLHRFLNEFINVIFAENKDNTINEYFYNFYYDNDSALWEELYYIGFTSNNVENENIQYIKDFVLEHLEDEVTLTGYPEGYREYMIKAKTLNCEFSFTAETKRTFNEFKK